MHTLMRITMQSSLSLSSALTTDKEPAVEHTCTQTYHYLTNSSSYPVGLSNTAESFLRQQNLYTASHSLLLAKRP